MGDPRTTGLRIALALVRGMSYERARRRCRHRGLIVGDFCLGDCPTSGQQRLVALEGQCQLPKLNRRFVLALDAALGVAEVSG